MTKPTKSKSKPEKNKQKEKGIHKQVENKPKSKSD
jgi:hypothetical protein